MSRLGVEEAADANKPQQWAVHPDGLRPWPGGWEGGPGGGLSWANRWPEAALLVCEGSGISGLCGLTQQSHQGSTESESPPWWPPSPSSLPVSGRERLA